MGLRKRQHMPSTASFGSYLHWLSHYLQSPLTAASGYMEILPEARGSVKQEVAQGIEASLVRSQAVLRAIVLLHQLLEQRPLRRTPVRLELVMSRVARVTDLKFSHSRKRSMPLVLASEDALVNGLGTMITALGSYRKRQSVVLSLKQARGETVLHLGLGGADLGVIETITSLASLDGDSYPLPQGEFIELSVGYVLVRESGVRMVVRPTHRGQLDVYLHLSSVRQLSLVDLVSQLG